MTSSTRNPATLNDPGFGTDPTVGSNYPDTHIGAGATTENPHPLAEAGQEVGQSAGQLAGRAKEIGFQQADKGRELTAEGLGKLSETLRRAAGDVQDQPMAANIASTVAEQTDRAATYLRQTDARQIVNNVEQMARKSPALFLAGAFVLGAVASRFIKAAGGASSETSLQNSRVPGYGSNRATGSGSDRGPNRGTGSETDSYYATGPGATGPGATGFDTETDRRDGAI
jgi:hypothetical protein